MSMSSEDIKDIKTTLKQILQNQSVMIAHLVIMANRKQQNQQQSSTNQMSSGCESQQIKRFLDDHKTLALNQMSSGSGSQQIKRPLDDHKPLALTQVSSGSESQRHKADAERSGGPSAKKKAVDKASLRFDERV